jgi:tetratricopeptide (TPR) repeat protein
MTEEREHNESARRPLTLSPWLVLLAGLALYGATLNHWVTLSSLPLVSRLTGWDWHPGALPWRPNFQAPLCLVLTFPFRLLPAGWRPAALNLFTAACAALTLAVLARSVRLLPQDRTKEQRQREGGEFALLSMRAAFLPAAFAVAMLAGQLTFWENAVAATGEMLDLLVFAFLILCLLEYRTRQNERWLTAFVLVYGLGVTNNWALIAFFPCFLAAMIWVKGLGFFQLRFALRMTGWGVLGLTLYLLTPLSGVVAGDAGFWTLLHMELGDQSFFLKLIPRAVALVAWALIFVPLLFAAIRWPSFEAELSAYAHDLTRGLFRLLHLVLLGFVALMFFDLRFSPNPQRMGLPGFMSFYYLAALCLGYYSAYVLLVFGRDVVYRWGQARQAMRLVNRVVVGALWVAVVAVVALPVLLFRQNIPRVRAANSDAVAQFGEAMVKSLPARQPPNQTLVLADDPTRLRLAAAACERLGKADQYIFLETQSLTHREYFRFLTEHYPQLKKVLINPSNLPPVINGQVVSDLLRHLAQPQQIYYLHPSVGYYFEQVYMTPRGLGGDLRPYQNRTNALEAPTLTAAEITRNQAFWREMRKGPLAELPALSELSDDAVRVGIYYSQALNYWGVELQKAATEKQVNKALLQEAADQFDEAIRLNPDNYLARLNRRYNASLLGETPPANALISWQVLAGRVGSWVALMNIDGPSDAPELNLLIGRQMALAGDYFQAVHLFQRCLEQRPGNPVAELDKAKTYVDMGLCDEALEIMNQIHEQSRRDPSSRPPDDLARVEALAHTKKGDFAGAERLLVEAQEKNPKDENFLGVMVEFYKHMAYIALGRGDAQPAARLFANALAAVDKQLELLNSPQRSPAGTREIPDAMLIKAEMQMMLKKYNDAIVTLTQVSQMEPEDPKPLLNRAISELQAGKIQEAKADYMAADKMTPGPYYVIYYGLTQVAQQQKDKAAEARYGKLYLKYAPRQTSEYTNVTVELQKLESR